MSSCKAKRIKLIDKVNENIKSQQLFGYTIAINERLIR